MFTEDTYPVTKEDGIYLKDLIPKTAPLKRAKIMVAMVMAMVMAMVTMVMVMAVMVMAAMTMVSVAEIITTIMIMRRRKETPNV